ncbi:MAG: Ig-like domain-containing protein [Bacteroidota bacterium]
MTSASGGLLICSNKAVGGATPAYTTLGTITIAEGSIADINGGSGGITNTLVLNAPTGWQFSTVVPTFSYITGSNITAVYGTITATALTVYIVANNTNNTDQVFINGLQVQATSTSAAAGNIYASTVAGIAGITTGTGGTNFGSLSPNTPVTPSISISASPSGAICPGTSVTFTPSAANGGSSPSYQWALNGTNVATGPTYTIASLASGNTVLCTLTSSIACVTASTAASNVITMTVNAAPAAITGSTVTCPGFTSSLADATTGGTWSSTNTSIATVNSSGVVSGVAAGTTTISYSNGSCAATTTCYVNLPPATPALTPTVTTVCNGTTLAITAAGTPSSSTILSQNFNTSIAPWVVDNTGSVGTLPGSEWKSCFDGYINELGIYHSPDYSTFAMSNSDTSGSASYTLSQLISPAFSTVGYSGATLTFQHTYEAWTGDINVKVDISTDGGGSWTTLRSYLGTTVGTKTSFVTENFSLNSYLGQSNLKIRFYYYCHWGYYWAVDNVSITGVSSIVIPTWSPVTYLYTDPSATIPYTAGSAVSTVYLRSSSITTPTPIGYTATATSTGCTATAASNVTINPTPATITGIANICVGSTTTLANTSGGGTWASSNTAVATINSSTGIALGVSTGTAVISYIAATGCAATRIITVNTTPATISGTAGVCIGATTTLSNATTGGTWTSSNTSVGAVGAATGLVSGLAVGTTNITYSLGVGCIATRVVTVSNLPASITGTTTVCMGLTTTLADASTGGTWSSGATGTATVGSTTGIVTGVAAGTTLITYTTSLGAGCFVTAPVTVNPLAPITGDNEICAGLTTTLANIYGGGTWSSSATPVATITSGGVVSGGGSGTTVISYILPTGCTATMPFTVNPLPAAIGGTMAVCVAATTTLTNATSGGTWSSSSTTVATIGSATGIVSGLVAGNTTITYTLPTGCITTAVVTVNPLPAAITGATSVCVGFNSILNNTSGGGSWSSSNTSIAFVNATTGVATGLAPGVITITYTLATGCIATTPFTVNPLPAAVTGSGVVCVGLTTSLSNSSTGGIWSSSNTGTATVGLTTGVVSGLVAGTVNISYTLPTGCIAFRNVTVYPLPAAITGPSAVCAGLTITMADATTGGTWSSGNTTVTVGSSSGIVTGVTAGPAVITYSLGTGCITTTSITVNPLPAAISGPTAVCQGLTISLTDASTGGTWSSSTTSVATIGATSGIVNGTAAGTTIITYTLPTGCINTLTVTVNTLPVAIAGPSTVCITSTITLTDATTGGTWATSTPTVAQVGVATGIVTGISAGTANITYSVATGCIAVKTITVNSLPAGITGASLVCAGSSILLSNATTGGTWSSGSMPTAVVNPSTGVVTGASAGTVVITYTIPTGCTATKPVTVNMSPVPTTGSTSVCQSFTTVLSNATPGGTWSSTNATVASVGATTGVVTGFASGMTVIFYTLSTGCAAGVSFTVNPLPSSISGSLAGCTGSTTTLSNSVGGGTWASGNTAVATIGASNGIVTGIAPGTAAITYTLGTGCAAYTTVTINTSPNAISGSPVICVGGATLYTNSSSGGTWSSSNVAIASIGSSSGFLVGYAVGTASISYTLANGCSAISTVTVNPVPAAISGPSTVCNGQIITLSNSTSGGTWNSSNTSVATIGAGTGILTGAAPGIVTIIYTMGGCNASKSITVNAAPAAITGTATICQGSTATFSSTTTGGNWTSSNTGVATVSAATGIVSGAAPGTATITYMIGTGCYVTQPVTVSLSPTAIIGLSSVCIGNSMTLTNATSGGTWTSTNPSVATVGGGTGIVSGVAAGTTTIAYAVTMGCSATKVVTVNPGPSSITGATALCTGGSITLSDATPGGSWISSSTTVATIGSATGIVVAGASPGTTNISYTLSTGCLASVTLVINTMPAITGTTTVCVGVPSSLSNTATGGTWTSSTTAVATVGASSGVLTGVSSGLAIVTYTQTAGCRTTRGVTVNPLPSPITGTATACPGSVTTLGDATPGGTWSSSTTSVATVGSATGIVTGIVPGTSIITYTVATGCLATVIVTVNPLPPAISGSSDVCLGATTTLTNAAPGGFWISSNTSVASVTSSGGVVMGYSLSTATIVYALPTGCLASIVVSVNPLPATITGPAGVCQGLTIMLADATPGGTWSSSNTAIATIGSATGELTGLLGGVATISYTATTGCYVTKNVSVNTLPSPITGSLNVCEGATTTLSNTATGGTWSSSNTSVSTIGIINGIVTGILAGTANITYTPVSGCITTSVVTVDPIPTAITGPMTVCAGSSVTLIDTSAGGTWTSGSTSIATIASGTGVLTGIAAGTTTITYTLGVSCIATAIISVNPLPAAITGPASVCVGYSMVQADATTGGTWSSSTTAVATIDAATGLVSGTTAGTATITYTIGTGCYITRIISVNPLPAAVSGGSTVCVGTATLLTNATTGGVWTSNNTAVASINATSGIVNGNASGTVIITYTLATGCFVTWPMTVNPLPSGIAGTINICAGFTTTLSNASPGGTWSSSNPAIATVGSATGLVNGIAAGTSVVTYTLSTGCIATAVVTVNTLLPITGIGSICSGSATSLSNATGSGTWSSSNTAVATVPATTGMVSGIAAGTATITFTYISGCFATSVVTVNLTPAPITGPSAICVGSAATLGSASTGGSWSSSGITTATIGSATGIITGIAPGTVTILYSLGAGCVTTRSLTVNAIPAAITGTTSLCTSFTTTLANATPGGTWSALTPAVATVGASTGIVTGISAGTTVVSYTLATGCASFVVVTVNALTPITGAAELCIGATTTLGNTSTGGTWNSANPSVATIGTATGIVSGLTAGNATIVYSYGSGCIVSAIVTVHPLPVAIAGPSAVCVGSSIVLADASAGGTWNTTGTGIVAVGAGTGIISGLSTGSAIITYTLPTGCATTYNVTVNPLPDTIAGITAVCAGLTTTLANASAGGTWSSSNTAIATINSATGVVTGIAGGTATITYMLPTGCISTVVTTVDPLPALITGTASVCVGLTTTLTNAATGGTWASSASGIATVGSTSGIVSGIASGTSAITYTLPTGCLRTTIITVNALPAAITGTALVCAASATTLANATPGGTWSSAAVTIATVNTAGVVTGVAAGTTFIVYTLGTGCVATATVTVHPLPAAISGVAAVCAGLTTTLSNTTPSGTWTSGNPAVATIGATGIVSGIVAGTSIITYTLPTGCSINKVVTVNPLPAAISGPSTVCVSLTAALSNATPGGIWISSDPTLAVVNVTSGVVSGVAAGSVTITYSLATGCIATAGMSVNPAPAAITGSMAICAGFTTALSSATPGGTWISGATAIAAIGSATGIASGITAGMAPVTYQLGSGCIATAGLTVNALPPAIAGVPVLCLGSSATLTNTATGGTWSTSGTVATVGMSTGVVTAVTLGIAVISYTLPTGCYAVKTVTTDPVPTAIAGISSVCQGYTTTLFDFTAGGTWSSSNTAIATVGSATGIVTGVGAGAAVISYILPTGCAATKPYTVYPLFPIAGPSAVCLGSVISLSDAAAGGTWSSSNPAVAAIGSATGIVSGNAIGSATITYALSTGCMATTTISVNPVPVAITGPSIICQGYTITLGDATPGGSWSSGTLAVASVGSASGFVTGVAPGTAAIIYTLPTGCSAFKVVTVNALLPITGTTSLCLGSSSLLSNAIPGGTWLSSTIAVATIGSGDGITMAHASGTAIISYLLPSGCLATATVTVNTLPWLYTVTGGGAYCSGGIGLPVGVDGSNIGNTYRLYRDAALVASLSGTGGPFTFGLHTAPGLYTITSVSNVTGCSRTMSGVAIITAGVPVAPAVTISTGIGDTVCEATYTTFTAFPVNGGFAPVYQWKVNGTIIPGATAATYNYMPAAGDIVTCRLTSNASCASPDTAVTSLAVTIIPLVMPAISISVSPDETVCQFTPVTFTPTATHGGAAPTFTWVKNSTPAGSGTSYSYTPADGDLVHAVMHSTAACRLLDSVSTADIAMYVTPYTVPSVTIIATPGTSVAPGTTVTFTAAASAAGPSPSYQWFVNTAPVPGETNSTYTSSSFGNADSVSCMVTSSGVCSGIQGGGHVIMHITGVGVAAINEPVRIGVSPNPNTGTFTVSGHIDPSVAEAAIRITDLLGRTIYTGSVQPRQGRVEQAIQLGSDISNGTYLLEFTAAEQKRIFHLSISR